MLKTKKFYFIGILILLLAFFGYQKIIAQKTDKTVKINVKKAKSAEVKKNSIEKYLIFAGKIEAQNYAILRFQTLGMLTWVGVKEGDIVKKWQVVASLDKESLKKTFEKEMNDYLTSRWTFEDTQDQYKSTKNKYLVTPEIQRILDRQQSTLNNSVLDL